MEGAAIVRRPKSDPAKRTDLWPKMTPREMRPERIACLDMIGAGFSCVRSFSDGRPLPLQLCGSGRPRR